MAGDLHHYMRHSYEHPHEGNDLYKEMKETGVINEQNIAELKVPSDKPVYVQHLLVNGCGGAFLHPTHVFKDFKNYGGTSYISEAAYPSFEDSSRVMNLYVTFLIYNSSVVVGLSILGNLTY